MVHDVELIDDIISIVENDNGNFDSERICEMLTFLSEERTRYTTDDLK